MLTIKSNAFPYSSFNCHTHTPHQYFYLCQWRLHSQLLRKICQCRVGLKGFHIIHILYNAKGSNPERGNIHRNWFEMLVFSIPIRPFEKYENASFKLNFAWINFHDGCLDGGTSFRFKGSLTYQQLQFLASINAKNFFLFKKSTATKRHALV